MDPPEQPTLPEIKTEKEHKLTPFSGMTCGVDIGAAQIVLRLRNEGKPTFFAPARLRTLSGAGQRTGNGDTTM